MGRPKAEPGTVAADERLVAAFWEALAEKPLREVTVAELCRRAGCNKTTFYYYFHDLDDLVQCAEGAFLAEDFPTMLLELTMEDPRAGEGDRIEELIARLRPLIERARLLMGPDGDAAFSPMMQRAMFERWCARLGTSTDKLDPYDALLLRHAMGGTAAVFAAGGEETDYRLLAQVIVDTMAPHLDRMLARYGAAAQGRPAGQPA